MKTEIHQGTPTQITKEIINSGTHSKLWQEYMYH